MKKVFSTVMATAICSSFVCSNLADTGLDFINAEEYHNALEWQDVYADTLKDYISSGVAKTAKFSLCYVDEDDIPELVVHSNGMAYHADTEVFLYTFYNGEVKNLGQISNDGYSNFTYYEKTGVVISGWLNQGLDYRVINKLSVSSVNSQFKDTSGKVTSGKCGENVYWELNSEGVFRVYGTGDMENYVEPDDNPWKSQKEYIRKVVIEEGITSIGFWTFSACENLKDIIISDSVNSIGYGAFSGSGLERIDIPSNLKSINSFAFANCTSLKSLDLPLLHMMHLLVARVWKAL